MNTNKIYILTDNEQDYLFYRKKYHGKNICWVTCSPYLINKIQDNKDLVINYENYLNSKIINHLMTISYDLSDKIINTTYKNFSFLNKKDVQLMFYRDLSTMIGSFLYKYYALNCFLREKKYKSEFIFIGKKITKSDLNHPNYFYDDVIFDLAKCLNLKNFKFLSSNYKSKKNLSFKNLFLIKFLSLLNLNVNSFLYKIYRSLPFKFFSKNKKNVFIFNEVYVFENNFLSLFKKFNIDFINFKFEKFKIKKNIKNNKILLNKLNKIIKYSINKKNYFSNLDYKPVLETILFHHFQIINNFKYNQNEINKKINIFSKKFKTNDLILSNTLERPLNLYMYLKLKKKVKFAFFEHGQTSGYQKAWDIRKKSQTIQLGKYAFFSHIHSLNVQKKYISAKTLCKVVGSSKFYFEKKNFLLKFIIKIILGVPIFKKSVVYVADLFRNNSTYSPFIGRDVDILNDTQKIIKYIKSKHSYDFKVLKTYPSSLYKDDFKFDKISDFKIISNYNWMYIYYIFDEIYFSAIQSSWLYKNKFQKINLVNRYKYPIKVREINELRKLRFKSKNFQIYKLLKEKVVIDDGSWIRVLN